jgi:hypothetical protein
MACNNNCSDCNCTETENVCGCCKYSAEDVAYVGPTLPCSGIENCDPLPEALAKMDEYICSVELAQTIISYITNNVEIYNQFVSIVNNSVNCETVLECLTTTTTTTCACNTYSFETGEGVVGTQEAAYFECGELTSLVVLQVEVGQVYEVCIENYLGIAASDKIVVTKLECCPTTTTTTTTV